MWYTVLMKTRKVHAIEISVSSERAQRIFAAIGRKAELTKGTYSPKAGREAALIQRAFETL
jgi:hypothetical protein